jgi:hypothetical protein
MSIKLTKAAISLQEPAGVSFRSRLPAPAGFNPMDALGTFAGFDRQSGYPV